MTLRKVAVFPNDNNPDTNQWPIDPNQRKATHGGANYPIGLGPAEIELIRRENPSDGTYSTDDKIQWAVRNIRGGIYYSAFPGDLAPWDWAAVIMGSKSTTEYNSVMVLRSDKGKSEIAAIPVLPDYSSITRALFPWLFHRVWVTNRQGCFDSPKGVFWMPLFHAQGRPHPRGELTGMWIKNEYLGGTAELIPPVEPPEPPALEYWVIAIRRTVLRQGPSANTNKMGVLMPADGPRKVLQRIGDWGLTVGGWVLIRDTKQA